jgi:hypothetical protein
MLTMKIIKGALLVVLFFVCMASGLYAAANRGLIRTGFLNQASTKLAQFKTRFPEAKVPDLPTDTSQQVSTLASRSAEVGKHATQVLGDKIQVNEEDKDAPIHERAFEYGRYLYCQEVIKDFERNNPTFSPVP